MGEKVNLNVHTQARAYQLGFREGLQGCVDALVEGGDINYLLEYIENNADEATRNKMNEYYDRRNAAL
jgi:hypothetical protein